jgi:hypothetical protein
MRGNDTSSFRFPFIENFVIVKEYIELKNGMKKKAF